MMSRLFFGSGTSSIARYFLLVWCLSACSKEAKKVPEQPSLPPHKPLFELLTAARTSLTFVNKLPESRTMNSFVYEYYYNGGGVAAGDLNNDGLDDLYFTSNLSDNVLYLNTGHLKFKDVTAIAGVAGQQGWATGVTMADVNGDGLLDIYVCRSGRYTENDKRRNELFINQGPNRQGIPVFKEEGARYGLDDPSTSTQASFFDYDRDGDLDMFLANHNIEIAPVDIRQINDFKSRRSTYGGNKMFENRGGKFVDVTDKVGMTSHLMNYALSISVSDVNNDQWPDMYVAVDYAGADHLYINQHDGTFADAIQYSLGHFPLASMGSDIGDVNNDGLADIMTLDMASIDHVGAMTSQGGLSQNRHDAYEANGLHHQYSKNSLQLNRGITASGRPLYADIAQFAGIDKTDWSWAPLIADFDNDGLNDLFISNGVLRDFINIDYNRYIRQEMERVKQQKKNPFLYFGKWTELSPRRPVPNFLYKNQGDMVFSDISGELNGSRPSFSNGAIYADLDNDGDLDLVVNNINTPAYLYENKSNTREGNHFLPVALNGEGKNTHGVGAKVMIKSNGQWMVREQFPTRGYQSAVSETLHFGLGKLSVVDSLTVVWPSGKRQVLTNVEADRLLVLSEKNATTTAENTAPRLLVDRGIKPLDFTHKENKFNDFAAQPLLPQKYSRSGPAVAVGDINNDGLQDIFMGGARQQASVLLIQSANGTFRRQEDTDLSGDRAHEDVDALFFDADQDGDQDLYVVSGGQEESADNEYYEDRFYENVKGRFVKKKVAIPKVASSGSCVVKGDYDEDGDLDLFIGGRIVPGKYPVAPASYLLRNDSNDGDIKFTDVTATVAPGLEAPGMVADAAWVDMDTDGQLDLVVVGEWMPISIFKNTGGELKNITAAAGLSRDTGWWRSISVHDFDGDGDQDFVVGNLGLNSKYKVDAGHPLEIYAGDFDNNGTFDIVMGMYEQDVLYPVHGFKNASRQNPFINKKFKTYNDYARASLPAIYGQQTLQKAMHLTASNMASVYVENEGSGHFRLQPLPNLAQLGTINNINLADLDGDGHPDLLLTGNLYDTESYTTRYDAGYGWCLFGNGKGKFVPRSSASTLGLKGQVSHTGIIQIADEKWLIAGINDGRTQLLPLSNRQ